MSALAGIFKFDPRTRVYESELMDLAHGIEGIGPDGGGQHLCLNLGMAYRAFHTTPESYLESQPLVRERCILTWDGRLDNREEIRTSVNKRFEDAHSDIDLVFAAYREWGTKSFARLIGDWSLALWDESEEKLFLARDCFGVRTLFYTVEEGAVRWCSILEPLVLHATRTLTVDLQHIAGCVYPYPPLGTTPYRELQAVIPAHFVTFEYGGKSELARYWALNPNARIRYSSDTEYEDHFRLVFREAVRRRIRSDRPVLLELSGGLDSSSIVCMADAIRANEAGGELATLSYYDSEEPSGDERPYISEIERLRGQTGHHISISDFNRETRQNALEPLYAAHFTARPGYFCKALRWAEMISAIQKTTRSRVILSGLGGDEYLGGVQYEALELAEHLFAGRIRSLFLSMFRWSLARKKPIITLAKDTWDLCRPRASLDSLLKSPTPLVWCNMPPKCPDAVFERFSSWHTTAPVHFCAESTRYTLASMLSCIDPPLTGAAERRYPYLDRSLYEFMASIPRTQVIRPNERRSLMRRSLSGLVPDVVLQRKTKWFGHRSSMTVLRGQDTTIDRMFDEPWISDGVLFDSSLIRQRLRDLQLGVVSEGLPLFAALAIEQWLRREAMRGRTVLPDPDPPAPIATSRRRPGTRLFTRLRLKPTLNVAASRHRSPEPLEQ